jgi:hypothetical protein
MCYDNKSVCTLKTQVYAELRSQLLVILVRRKHRKKLQTKEKKLLWQKVLKKMAKFLCEQAG